MALTDKGLKRFDEYLCALADVLRKAQQAVATDRRRFAATAVIGKRAFA